jgi:hypothetical protein
MDSLEALLLEYDDAIDLLDTLDGRWRGPRDGLEPERKRLIDESQIKRKALTDALEVIEARVIELEATLEMKRTFDTTSGG